MEKGQIFDSDDISKLPSLSGLSSTCEEELILLMQEINSTIKDETCSCHEKLKNRNVLCKAQSDEIEKTNGMNVNEFKKEAEHLRKKNAILEKEKQDLLDKLKKAHENEREHEILKRQFKAQQEENNILHQNLTKLDRQLKTLELSYSKLINNIAVVPQNENEKLPEEIDLNDIKNKFIDNQVKNLLSEEEGNAEDFRSKIALQIEELQKHLAKEIGN